METPDIDRKDLIITLSRHQDQLTKFLDSMEAIRWKFITAFGVGASFALVFASMKDVPPDQFRWKAIVATTMVVLFSIASLITQIRIYGLMHCSWERICELQRLEAKYVKDLYHLTDPIDRLFQFPYVSSPKSNLSHLLTVHMATCLVFSGLIGTASAILANAFGSSSRFWLLAVGGIATVAIYVCTWQTSSAYAKQIQHWI